jgi:8-oxo-dGTP diphosphatase
LRELQEEADIILVPEQVQQAGVLHFFREAKPERNQDVHIFRGSYDGDFAETEEMRPQWRDTDKLPFEDMREDDVIWMPKLIAGEYFDLDFRFDREGKLSHPGEK